MNLGTHHSEETKEKMKNAHMGVKAYNYGKHLTEETRKKISNTNKGRVLSEEWKQKIGKANKGKHKSEETKLKVGNSNKGKHHSEETKLKMSKSHTGKKHSKETKLKISRLHKGKLHLQFRGVNNSKYGTHPSEETREKMSKAKKGKPTGRPSPFRGKYGVESSNWKGGITKLNGQIYNSFKYRQWRSDIFTRDNFTCQECGIRGEILNAHHIKPFSKIIQFYEITTLQEALECEELWNINNGITLCKKCHKVSTKRNRHKIFAKRGEINNANCGTTNTITSY